MTRLGQTHTDIQYRKDFVNTNLGSGQSTFSNAVQSMRAWHHFAMDWIHLFPENPAMEPTTTLLVCANHRMFWSVNACKIIDVIDESSESTKRFGYSYGTLPQHVEQGEELFLLEWDLVSDRVTYSILAYSKPNHPLVAIFWPAAGLIQDYFRKQSLLALKNSLENPRC